MANILDIFRSYAGDKLIERSSIISGVQEEKLLDFYSSVFPIIITQIPSENLKRAPGTQKLIAFLEAPEFPEQCKQLVKDNLEATFNEDLKAKAFDKIIEKSAQDKLFTLAVASAFVLIKEIHASNTSLDYGVIKRTLLGFDQSASNEFVACIVKNKEGAHLIDNPNKIALSDKHDDSDQSILGGYAGGR